MAAVPMMPMRAVAGGQTAASRAAAIHHAQIRHGQLGRLGGGVSAGHRAAGRHDALDIFGEQERDVLPGILEDDLRAAAAVGDTTGITKIDDVLVGEDACAAPARPVRPPRPVSNTPMGRLVHAAFHMCGLSSASAMQTDSMQGGDGGRPSLFHQLGIHADGGEAGQSVDLVDEARGPCRAPQRNRTRARPLAAQGACRPRAAVGLAPRPAFPAGRLCRE